MKRCHFTEKFYIYIGFNNLQSIFSYVITFDSLKSKVLSKSGRKKF